MAKFTVDVPCGPIWNNEDALYSTNAGSVKFINYVFENLCYGIVPALCLSN